MRTTTITGILLIREQSRSPGTTNTKQREANRHCGDWRIVWHGHGPPTISRVAFMVLFVALLVSRP
jgi:hypothetical protein